MLKSFRTLNPAAYAVFFQNISAMKVGERLGFFEQVVSNFSSLAGSDEDSRKTFKLALLARIKALGAGTHGGEAREVIVGKYYKAYNDIEDAVCVGEIEENNIGFEGKIKFYRVKSLKEHAQGVAIIAKVGDEIIGRMFIANSAEHDHLSIMSTKDFEDISKKLIAAKMFETYFNSKDKSEEEFLKSRDIRTSCIGFYSPTLRELSEDLDHSLLGDKKVFPAINLSKISYILLQDHYPDVMVEEASVDKVLVHDLEHC